MYSDCLCWQFRSILDASEVKWGGVSFEGVVMEGRIRSEVLLNGFITWSLFSCYGLSVFPTVPVSEGSAVARGDVIVVLSLTGVLGRWVV